MIEAFFLLGGFGTLAAICAVDDAIRKRRKRLLNAERKVESLQRTLSNVRRDRDQEIARYKSRLSTMETTYREEIVRLTDALAVEKVRNGELAAELEEMKGVTFVCDMSGMVTR